MGLYRLSLSLTIPFFLSAWIDQVGAGWCLGMAALFSVFAYSGILVLMWKGHELRRWSFASVLSSNEAGTRLVQEVEGVSEP